MWTRFMPLANTLERLLHHDKVIGELRHVKADYSTQIYDSESKGETGTDLQSGLIVIDHLTPSRRVEAGWTSASMSFSLL
jgi:hypothetical protein